MNIDRIDLIVLMLRFALEITYKNR